MMVAPIAGAQSPFDAARLVLRSDSFAVVVQGRTVGGVRETIERTATGFRLTSAQAMAGMSQSTNVDFSKSLEMRAVKQTGQVRGSEMKIDVTYDKGRAKGSATTPGPQGLKTIVVDTTVPRGAVDDNLLQGLLHTLPLGEGKSFTIPVFSSGQGTTTMMTAKVVGAESVTVPAGTFDTWKLEISGGPVPVQFWVSKAQPRVVKLGFGGAPMAFELVK
jgi:hypothetical protein